MSESSYETLRLIVWVFGLPIIIALLIRIIRRVRAIHELDARLREEEEQQAKNPYGEMARMYEAQELLERTRRGR
jgi:hypothetical protein